MSQPSKCDICGTRHHAHQAHVFASAGPPDSGNTPDARKGVATPVATPRTAGPPSGSSEKKSSAVPVPEKVSENDSPALSQSERNARYRVRNREKYNAYMRDYRRRKK